MKRTITTRWFVNPNWGNSNVPHDLWSLHECLIHYDAMNIIMRIIIRGAMEYGLWPWMVKNYGLRRTSSSGTRDMVVSVCLWSYFCAWSWERELELLYVFCLECGLGAGPSARVFECRTSMWMWLACVHSKVRVELSREPVIRIWALVCAWQRLCNFDSFLGV